MLAVPRQRRENQRRPQTDLAAETILKGGDSGPAAVAGDAAGKPARPGGPLRPGAEDAAQRASSRTARSRCCRGGSRWGCPGPKQGGGTQQPRPREAAARDPDPNREFWSFQPVKPIAVPVVREYRARSHSPIDRFLLADLEKNGLSPAQPADRRTLIRRATFDLIGLPPTPEEIDAFLADDSPDAFARVVDRLLASPRYGERWGRHWLDVVRYADARDLIQLPAESDFREAWRYRDWVVAAFNHDLPYTEFIRYQIAGDLLPPPSPAQSTRTGSSPRACSPSPTSCPATSTRTR